MMNVLGALLPVDFRQALGRILFLALVAGSFLLFACGGGDEGEKSYDGNREGDEVAVQEENLPTISVPALWAWGDAGDLATLIRSADVVFSGKVVALKGQRPAISGGAGAGSMSPRWGQFPISQFEVGVEGVITGDLTSGSTITFEQAGGVQTRPDGTSVRVALENDEPMRVGESYLFFASLQEDGSMGAPPFGRMQVGADGRLSASADWSHLGALQQLDRMHVDDAEREIRAVAGN